MNVLSTTPNFQSLSLKDLLEAREHYHLHLLNKRNVVGTAVGLYLIRNSDLWPDEQRPNVDRTHKPKGERTLENSGTRPYSWPCVLVLVDNWIDEEKMPAGFVANDVIPKTLYMPDGRTIPVCVVKVQPIAPAQAASSQLNWPDTRIGGGFPVFSTPQHRTLDGSVGCLATDGHTLFALTNRHVVGKPGEPVYTRLRGDTTAIGVSGDAWLDRKPFNEVYPYLPESRAFSTLDVGLIDIDDARDWTSQSFGMKNPGPLADVNEMNLGTKLIDQRVVAYGGFSGPLSGRIKALFYRYQAVAGYDYVSDLLIAPDQAGFQTVPGDSGTVWHLVLPDASDPKQEQQCPLAIEWGGQGLFNGTETRNFALATLLSHTLHQLKLELVTGHNTGARPFWGATGHYSIARYAISMIDPTSKLGKLLNANAVRISFDRGDLESGDINSKLAADKFVPLADVPDIVWKKPVSNGLGGRDNGSDKPEHPTHYADIDQPGPNNAPSLIDLCESDNANVDVDVWRAFYDSVESTKQASRGLLPFRVWQFFNEMKTFASNEDVTGFVAAAGILAHYIGDACQPLHGSVLSNGYQEQTEEKPTSTGKTKKVWPAQGVHSAYEDKMIDDHTTQLFDGIEALSKPSRKWPKVSSGHSAAVAIVALMAESQRLLPPADICDVYIQLGGGTSKATSEGLWKKFGKPTIQTMYNGAAVLALVWEAAWAAGSGDKLKASSLKEISEAALEKRYRDVTFVESLDLDSIKPALA